MSWPTFQPRRRELRRHGTTKTYSMDIHELLWLIFTFPYSKNIQSEATVRSKKGDSSSITDFLLLFEHGLTKRKSSLSHNSLNELTSRVCSQ